MIKLDSLSDIKQIFLTNRKFTFIIKERRNSLIAWLILLTGLFWVL